MVKDHAMIIVAIGIGLSLAIPQVSACDAHLKNQIRLERDIEAKEANDWWIKFVEPNIQLCRQQGGMPQLSDTPNTGKWDWQVTCNYPPQFNMEINDTVIRWIHNDKSAAADEVRRKLRDLGWDCCTKR